MPALTGVLETALYVDDVDRATTFYHDLFGFTIMLQKERVAALDVAGRNVLLLFLKGGTPDPIVDEGGTIPPHDGDGNLHMAFSIPAESYDGWEETLAAKGVEVVARYRWELGGRSVYFHDPDGHLIELVTPGCWANY